MVHRLLYLSDLTESVNREMQTLIDHLDDSSETKKIVQLRRSQWICFEERHDDPAQVSLVPHVVTKKILTVVIVPAVPVDVSASEEVLDHFQDVDTSLTLNNRKTGLALPTDLHYRIPVDRGTKTALAVDEADDPLLEP